MKRIPTKRIAAFLLALMMVTANIMWTPITADAAAKAPTKITLSAAKKSLTVGKKFTLKVKSVTPSNASKSVSFKTSKKSIATVTSKGVVTGKKVGTATITVTSKVNKKIKATCKVTVKPKATSVTMNKTVTSLKKGSTMTLKTTFKPASAVKTVTWKSSKPSVATVTSKGVVKAKKAGTTTITATAKDGSKKKATCIVGVYTKKVTSATINTAKKTLNVGGSYTLKIKTVKPSGASSAFQWSTSKKSVATVDAASGKVKAVKAGTAKITGTATDGSKKKVTCTITVLQPVKKVAVSPKKVSVPVKATTTLEATITPTNASNKNVTWSSSDASIATVDAKGVVTGVKEGTATITALAKDGSGKSATSTITVTPEPVSITGLTFKSPMDSYGCTRVVVSLNKEKELKTEDFVVKIKANESGTYNHTLPIRTVATVNNVDYEIELKDGISNGEYVNCTITGLDGIASMEQKYVAAVTPGKTLVSGVIGTTKREWDIDFGPISGYSTSVVSDGTLPAGLIYDDKDEQIKGRLQALANNQKAVISATDELGAETKNEVNFLIGDENSLFVENKTVGDMAGDLVYTHKFFTDRLTVVGGSGNYKYELIDSCNGKFVLGSTSGGSTYSRTGSLELNATAKDMMEAGTYTARVRVTDLDNPARVAEGTLTVVLTSAVAVTTTLNNTTEYDNLNVMFLNMETGKSYGNGNFLDPGPGNSFFNTQTAYMPAGTYEVYITPCNIKYVLERDVKIESATSLSYNLSLNKISGTVLDKNGVAYEQLYMVQLYLADDLDTCVYTAKYMEDGTYSFDTVPAGNYVVEVSYHDAAKSSFVLGYTSGVITVGGSDVVENFTLPISNLPKITGTLKDAAGNVVTDENWQLVLKDESLNHIETTYMDATGVYA